MYERNAREEGTLFPMLPTWIICLTTKSFFLRLHFLYSRDLNLLTLRDQKVEDLLYFL